MTARFLVPAAVTAALTCLAPRALHAQGQCGPIILAGHDADDHGFETVYAGLFNELFSNQTGGGVGILAVGPDVGGRAAQWILDVAARMVPPQSVTFVNDAAISTVNFLDYAILHVPSDNRDTSGGISQAEADLLTARAGDIAIFQNSGGGVFGLTQGELTDGWSWIGGVGSFTHLDVPPSGSLPSGNSFNDVTTSAEGRRLGITDTNVDGCCFHNVFTSYPSWLRVLAAAEEPSDAAFHGNAVFVGGVNRCAQLSVDWGDITARRTPAGVEIAWSTLDEDDTIFFDVHRATRTGSVWIGRSEARGAYSAYRVYDPAPDASFPIYWVQEYTSAGPGDLSPQVRADLTPPSAGGRERGLTPEGR